MIGRQWVGTVLVFIGLGMDSAYGKELKLAPKQKQNKEMNSKEMNSH